jgi:hypothetical protein
MKVEEKKDYLKQQLFAALESGWEIDEPVLLGELWRTSSGGEHKIYHLVLRNKFEGKTTLLSLPPLQTLQTFLSENNIQVNLLS